MAHIGMVALSVAMAVVFIMTSDAFAEEQNVRTSPQVTINENIANDPLAQDILKKIEQTKTMIAQMQQKELEQLEAQKELEEKRSEAFTILQRDLAEWEKLWEEFTFEHRFQRQNGIFWDHHTFTYSKILAGRAALQQVLLDGGNAEQARSAYVDAAKIKRSELIEVNAIYNVLRGAAYYNQQILFDAEGQFHDIISGDQLRKYYEDFRTNPAYLNANPNDEVAWKELARDKNTECRDGYFLIHRFHADDYVCVTESTSEMWARHGMGEILSSTIPLANDVLSVQKLREDRIKEKVKNINYKINSMYGHYEAKLQDIRKKYENIMIDLNLESLQEQKKIILEFNSGVMKKEEMSKKIENIRDRYQLLEDNTRYSQEQAIKAIQSNHKQDMKNYVKNFETVTDVKISWDDDKSSYTATRI